MLVAIAANFVMLAAGVLGSFAGHSKVRWVWLVISCLAFLVMLHHGGFHAHRAAGNKDVRTRRFFGALSGLGFVAFALFPMYVLTFSFLILCVCGEIVIANSDILQLPRCGLPRFKDQRRCRDRASCYPGYPYAGSSGLLAFVGT